MLRLIRLALFDLLSTLISATALASETSNQCGITMVLVPVGSFTMEGCTEEANRKIAFLWSATVRGGKRRMERQSPALPSAPTWLAAIS